MRGITYKNSSVNARLPLLAADALRARLFVPGWVLCDELGAIKRGRPAEYYKTSIAVAYLNSIPIGVCISIQYIGYDEPTAMVFVRKKYRRLGIGTKLFRKTTGGRGSGGVRGADKFWNKINKKT